MNKKGFTLIELLVVIAIISLLLTLAVIALCSAREKAMENSKLENNPREKYCIEQYEYCKLSCAQDIDNDLNDCLLRCDIVRENCK